MLHVALHGPFVFFVITVVACRHSPVVSSASVHHLRGRRACSWPLCMGWMHLHTTVNTYQICAVDGQWGC